MGAHSVPDPKPAGAVVHIALAILLISSVLNAPIVLADSLRCGNRLIVLEMAAVEVRRLCGEPEAIEVEERPIFARGPRGSVRTGTYQVERWLYPRRGGQFPAQLTFESGKLTRIELLTRTRS